MSMSGINGASRVTTPAADTLASTPTAPVRQVSTSSSVEIDEATQQPKPPRFPWLSRLSLQLESAAQQRSAFQAAPVLGDHIDKSA